jgi:hypothetical protein
MLSLQDSENVNTNHFNMFTMDILEAGRFFGLRRPNEEDNSKDSDMKEETIENRKFIEKY